MEKEATLPIMKTRHESQVVEMHTVKPDGTHAEAACASRLAPRNDEAASPEETMVWFGDVDAAFAE